MKKRFFSLFVALLLISTPIIKADESNEINTEKLLSGLEDIQTIQKSQQQAKPKRKKKITKKRSKKRNDKGSLKDYKITGWAFCIRAAQC